MPFINPELLPSKSKCVILSNVSFFFFSSNTTIGLVRRRVQAKKSKALDLDTFVLLFCVVPTITLLVYYYVCISFWHAHRSSQSSLSIHRPAQPVSTCDIVPKPGLPGRNVSQIMVTLWEDVRVSILGKWPMSFNGRGLPALTTCIYTCSMPKAGHFGQNEGPQNADGHQGKEFGAGPIASTVTSDAKQKGLKKNSSARK